MNWENLNYDEITFFCKNPKANMEFDCLPNLQTMVVQLIDMLQYYHIESFTAADMQKIFEILQMFYKNFIKIHISLCVNNKQI